MIVSGSKTKSLVDLEILARNQGTSSSIVATIPIRFSETKTLESKDSRIVGFSMLEIFRRRLTLFRDHRH